MSLSALRYQVYIAKGSIRAIKQPQMLVHTIQTQQNLVIFHVKKMYTKVKLRGTADCYACSISSIHMLIITKKLEVEVWIIY